MLPQLSELKARRKQFSITQADFARLANVSQSLVAKIESGHVIPSYENAKRLFDAIERLQEQRSASAADIMQRRVFSVHEKDTAKKAVSLMEKKAVSQLPVLNSLGVSVGTVSEENILRKIGKANGNVNLTELRVAEIMDDAFPSIRADTPIKIIQSMLEHSPAVLVVEKGKIRGIVTKADLLKAVLEKK